MPSITIHGTRYEVTPPRPRAVLLVARAVGGGRLDDRADATMRFLTEAVGTDAVEAIAITALFPDDGEDDGTDPVIDALYDVLEACSPRPYWVDTLLASVCARQWHVVSGRMARAGVTDPLRQLPSLAALLAGVEQLIIGDADKDARAAWFRHYLPPPEVVARQRKRELGR